jgi:hypothetical protein
MAYAYEVGTEGLRLERTKAQVELSERGRSREPLLQLRRRHGPHTEAEIYNP